MIWPVAAASIRGATMDQWREWWRRLWHPFSDGAALQAREENEARLAAALKEVDAIVADRRRQRREGEA